MKLYCTRIAIAAFAAAVSAASPLPPAKAQSLHISELASHTHVHGLAVDRLDPEYLLIATHHGLFRAGPEGNAERVSVLQDLMGFNPHPRDSSTLYASGHPAQGGNLGFIASSDGGKTWRQISPGVDGPVDFHQMTVSPADPQTIYGAYDGLQASYDGGKRWAVIGPVPDRLIDLAASAKNSRTLYAGTEGGLLVSRDGGVTWEALLQGAPVSMVEVAPGGKLYAFMLGRGLLASAEDPLEFQTVSGEWGNVFLLHLTVDPGNPDQLFAATQSGLVLASADGGKTWQPFGAPG